MNKTLNDDGDVSHDEPNQIDNTFTIFIAWIFHELNSLLNLITHLMYWNTTHSITKTFDTNTIDHVSNVLINQQSIRYIGGKQTNIGNKNFTLDGMRTRGAD